MNLQQTLKSATTKLTHLETPNLEAEVLLSTLLGKNRTWLKTHPEFELTTNQQSQFNDWLLKRVNHTPTAYITGRVNWNHLDLLVTADTLIPRDETETLCHHIKAQHPVAPKTILDVGTGSGCLACWAQTVFPEAKVTALDISEAALTVARKNAEKLQLPIDFKHSNLLQTLPNKSHYDLIIANLPYVPANLPITPEVKTEPHGAIFSTDKGLHHIKRLATELRTKPITFNQLWLEFLPVQAKTITKIFSDFEVSPFTAVDGQIFFAQIKPRV